MPLAHQSGIDPESPADMPVQDVDIAVAGVGTRFIVGSG